VSKSLNWKILSQYPADLIDTLLKNRKITDKEKFLNPKFEDLISPDKIFGIKEGARAIKGAIKKKEKFGVFCDYDADGISAGAIAHFALEKLSADAIYYVPTREEGYGLSEKAVDWFRANDIKIIITLDCGIRNNKEIAYAKKLGLKTIIVDHHQIGEKLPEAIIIVHTLLGKEKFFLSGGGVAYMLLRELLGDTNPVKWQTDLAAISTIADIVPLTGPSRIIAKYGLEVINKTKNIGLSELIKSAQIKNKIGTYEIGYLLAPRINASGRISKPILSFELLTTSDKKKAQELAQELSRLNSERQDMLETAQNEAIGVVEKSKLYAKKAIVLLSEKWSEGILGLISGRITEKYFRPSIVLTQRGENLRGSARSIPKVNITELIGKSSKYLTGFGGHEGAAGLTLSKKNFSDFKKSLINVADKIADYKFIKTLVVDAALKVEDLNVELAKKINELEPFGPGNPQPIFAVENVEIKDARKIGRDGNHLRARVCQDGNICHMVAFGIDKNEWSFSENKKYDLAFKLKLDTWQGRDKTDLILVDAKLSPPSSRA